MTAKHHEDRWNKLISNGSPAKGTGNKEDRPRYGKTTSRRIYNQADPTENNGLTVQDFDVNCECGKWLCN